jgi:feruloyl esterase
MTIVPKLASLFGLAILAIFFPDCAIGATLQAPTVDATEQCKALETTDFSQIPHAVTQIIETHLVEASNAQPEYCEVSGYVAPSTGFRLRLPLSTWNGKFLELGCGGACGSTDNILDCADPLRRGYACIVSDGGHKSSWLDMKWAANNPDAVINYFVLAPHLTALAGKAIVERYYDRAPKKSYFMGGSAGGIQATWAAQKFPWDFDGIVAGVPCLRVSSQVINWLWINRALTDRNGEALFKPADLELLHHAVAAECDLNDGVKDGLIGDPRACHFEPSKLRCPAKNGGACLTAQQVEAAQKIYHGPINSKGEQISPPLAQRGSELQWGLFVGSARHPTAMYNYLGGDWPRYAGFYPSPGPKWKPEDFDFDRDPKRLGTMETFQPWNSADLRTLKAAGGKLLMYTGWSDPIEGVLNTLSYYERAERVIGSRVATQSFFRLFVIPGMAHGPAEGADVVDWLSYLEAWAEDGQAPDRVIGSHLRTEPPPDETKFPLDPVEIAFSRPIYPYPTVTKYLGRGDPKNARSFGPRSPHKPN